MKILRFSRIQMEDIPGQRALMTIKFLDQEGEFYSWAPRWKDLENAFLKGINTEAFNKPGSEWLNSFANTVREVAEGIIQPIQSARKEMGSLAEICDGELCITTYDDWGREAGVSRLTPGFATTYEFLDNWLGKTVEALVINGVAVLLREKGSRRQYPLLPVEDLPF